MIAPSKMTSDMDKLNDDLQRLKLIMIAGAVTAVIDISTTIFENYFGKHSFTELIGNIAAGVWFGQIVLVLIFWHQTKSSIHVLNQLSAESDQTSHFNFLRFNVSSLLLGKQHSLLRLAVVITAAPLVLGLIAFVLFGGNIPYAVNLLLALLLNIICMRGLRFSQGLASRLQSGDDLRTLLKEGVDTTAQKPKSPTKGSLLAKLLIVAGSLSLFFGAVVGDQAYQWMSFAGSNLPIQAGRTINWSNTVIGAVVLIVGVILYTNANRK